MFARTKVYKSDGFEIEIRSVNKPNPQLAAIAILSLLLDILSKQISQETKAKRKGVV